MSGRYLRMGRQRPEDLIQKTVFQHIKQRGVEGLVALHVPNGGFRKPIEAAKLKGMGVVAGAPDVLLWHDGKAFALELKSPDGRLSEAQSEMLARLDRAGVFTCVAHGLDRAIAVLESWNLLHGRTV
jgi:VRR-NUC domain